MNNLHLTRKQLLDLLARLDCGQLGQVTSRTITVHDHNTRRNTHVTAVEDNEITEGTGHPSLASNSAS